MVSRAVRLTASGALRGARAMAPLSLFVIPFGVAFGVATVEHGMSAAQAIGASVLVFSGAAQFAALDIWGAEMSLPALFLVTLAVSARLVIMGAVLSPWVNHLAVRQRVLCAAFLSDPNFAHTHAALEASERDIGVLVGGGAIGWAAWVLGTAIGAIGGAHLGEPGSYGIDVLMPVYFAALLVPRIASRRRWGFVAVAALVAVGAQPILSSGWNVILAAVAGGIAGTIGADE